MKLPTEWMETLGAGAKVMILDAGIVTPPPSVQVQVRNFTDEPIEYNAQHGTDMAAIIASRDPLAIGVSPYCDLYFAKVMAKTVDWRAFECALQWAIDLRIDVLSMSFASQTVSRGFRDLIAELDARGVICCAADNSKTWAIYDPHVVSVGALGRTSSATVRTNGSITLRSPDGQMRPLHGTSVATAIMAGVAACAKSHEPRLLRPGFVTNLTNCSGERSVIFFRTSN